MPSKFIIEDFSDFRRETFLFNFSLCFCGNKVEDDGGTAIAKGVEKVEQRRWKLSLVQAHEAWETKVQRQL